MKKKTYTALGLMSGTSMDGVDLSIIKSDGDSYFSQISNNYYEFDNSLRNQLIDLRGNLHSSRDIHNYAKEIHEIERQFTLFNGKIINDTIKNYQEEVDLIGFHGQTIFHKPDEKNSIQLGDANLLSQLTKKKVVNNFRKKDLDNGGQGAPLAPIFHKVLTESIKSTYNLSFPINVLNIGGITNITKIFFKDDKSIIDFSAYDIAPGNCLLDEWVRKKSKKKFDKNGELARSGKVNELILNQALDNFSIRKFNKSLDVNDFDISFIKGLSLEDGCATLTKFSAFLIAEGIKRTAKFNSSSLEVSLMCGGGRKNDFLIESINENLDRNKDILMNIDNYGFDGDFVEAQAFGYLSIRTFLDLPISFPKTTGCKVPTVGGIIVENF